MKTAISLPDELFASADALAERLGMSRSQLFATAVAEYLAKHQTRRLTERLNAVYGVEPSALDPAVRRAQRRSIGKESW
jgi:metal-responsive CopG/Arc/MetJ family transcriptional regulator